MKEKGVPLVFSRDDTECGTGQKAIDVSDVLSYDPKTPLLGFSQWTWLRNKRITMRKQKKQENSAWNVVISHSPRSMHSLAGSKTEIAWSAKPWEMESNRINSSHICKSLSQIPSKESQLETWNVINLGNMWLKSILKIAGNQNFVDLHSVEGFVSSAKVFVFFVQEPTATTETHTYRFWCCTRIFVPFQRLHVLWLTTKNHFKISQNRMQLMCRETSVVSKTAFLVLCFKQFTCGENNISLVARFHWCAWSLSVHACCFYIFCFRVHSKTFIFTFRSQIYDQPDWSSDRKFLVTILFLFSMFSCMMLVTLVAVVVAAFVVRAHCGGGCGRLGGCRLGCSGRLGCGCGGRLGGCGRFGGWKFVGWRLGCRRMSSCQLRLGCCCLNGCWMSLSWLRLWCSTWLGWSIIFLWFCSWFHLPKCIYTWTQDYSSSSIVCHTLHLQTVRNRNHCYSFTKNIQVASCQTFLYPWVRFQIHFGKLCSTVI